MYNKLFKHYYFILKVTNELHYSITKILKFFHVPFIIFLRTTRFFGPSPLNMNINFNMHGIYNHDLIMLIVKYISHQYHCMHTALLEKANVRGTPLIERYLLRLLNSSSIRPCQKYTVQNKNIPFIKRCALYVGFF